MKRNSENLIHYGFIRGKDYASDVTRPEGIEEIDCGLGHSPFGFPEVAREALKNIDPRLLNEYPADPYSDALAANVRRRFGLEKKAGVFFDGAGSYGLLATILSNLVANEGVRRGSRVIGVGPQFTNIAMLAHRAEVPYQPLTPDLNLPYEEKLDLLVANREKDRQAAIVYVDNPNNPTGAAVGIDKIVDLAEATANGDLLIVDEAYGDAVPDSWSAFNILESYPHIIVVRSLSKTIGLASPRLGYVGMSEPVADVYREMRLVFTVDALTYLIAHKVMEPEVLAEFLPRVRQMTMEKKLEFLDILAKNGVNVFESMDTVSILLAEGGDNFYEKLFALGINTEDGATFEPTHPEMNNSMVRFRIPADSRKIQEVGKRLKNI